MPAKEKITRETLVGASELAGILGVTGQRVRQLVQDGILERAKPGQFLLCDSVQRYVAFKSRDALSEDAASVKFDKEEAEARLKSAKATIARLEAEELQGNMHRSEDVASMTGDLVYAIRSALLALPGRLAVNVSRASTPAEASEIIRAEVHVVMRELSQYKYDPQKYADRVRERMRWEEEHEETDE